jgi:hypothetical protein
MRCFTRLQLASMHRCNHFSSSTIKIICALSGKVTWVSTNASIIQAAWIGILGIVPVLTVFSRFARNKILYSVWKTSILSPISCSSIIGTRQREWWGRCCRSSSRSSSRCRSPRRCRSARNGCASWRRSGRKGNGPRVGQVDSHFLDRHVESFHTSTSHILIQQRSHALELSSTMILAMIFAAELSNSDGRNRRPEQQQLDCIHCHSCKMRD